MPRRNFYRTDVSSPRTAVDAEGNAMCYDGVRDRLKVIHTNVKVVYKKVRRPSVYNPNPSIGGDVH